MKFWSCREVSRMMASGEFDEGPVLRRLLARFHLLGCSYCRLFLRQMRLLSTTAKAWSHSLMKEDVRADFEKRLLKKLVPGI